MANVANILYMLRLPEEGDYWRQRMIALAPDSPVTRQVDLERLLAKNDKEQALIHARSMITDQIENRHGAFSDALIIHEQIMLERGKAKEAYDFLVSVRPEIVNYDALPKDMNGLNMQWSSNGLMSRFAPYEEHQEAWKAMAAAADATGFPWRNPKNPDYLWILVFEGDIEGAANFILETLLANPLTANLDNALSVEALLFPEVFADPRIQARMTEIRQEYESLRQQVRAMLASPEWNE